MLPSLHHITPTHTRPTFAPFDAARGAGLPETSPASARPAGGQEGAKGPRLDTNGASVHPTPAKPSKTRPAGQVRTSDFAQFGARSEARVLFNTLNMKGAACCGMKTPTGIATLKRGYGAEGNGSTLSGVSSCGSPWLCPVCGPKIAANRARDLAPQFNKLMGQGWTVWLITLTLRHEKGEALADLFDVLAKGWNRFRSGKAFVSLRDRAGGFEYVRGYDLTHGKNGWHPHLHLVVALGPGAGDGKDAAAAVLERWKGCLSALKREALDRGLDCQPARNPAAAAAYAMTLAGISKHADRKTKALTPEQAKKAAQVGFSTVAEATAAAAKRGWADGGETAADLREKAVAGNRRAFALFAEYARATKGRRAVVVSQGLKLQEEQEAATADDVIDAEAVAVLRESGLPVIDRHLPELHTANTQSAAAARVVLTKYLGPPSTAGLWTVPVSYDDPDASQFGPLSAAAVDYLKQEKERRAEARKRKKARKEQRKAALPPAG